MKESKAIPEIAKAIEAGEIDKALQMIGEEREHNGESAELYYLEGKAHMKHSDWGLATSAFLKSEQLEPDGPARQCREMIGEIMAFYNKDMYNQ